MFSTTLVTNQAKDPMITYSYCLTLNENLQYTGFTLIEGGIEMTNKDQIKGKVNEAVGKLTDDEKQELKGKAQQKVGDAKEKGKEATDNLADKVNKKIDEHDRK